MQEQVHFELLLAVERMRRRRDEEVLGRTDVGREAGAQPRGVRTEPSVPRGHPAE